MVNTAKKEELFVKMVLNSSQQVDLRYAFAKPVVDMKKIVFSRKLKKSQWKNTGIATGNYIDYIQGRCPASLHKMNHLVYLMIQEK